MNKNNSMNTDSCPNDSTINTFTLSITSMADFDMPTGTTLPNTHTPKSTPNQLICRRCDQPLTSFVDDLEGMVCSLCTMIRISEMAEDDLDLNGYAYDFFPDAVEAGVGEKVAIDEVHEDIAIEPVAVTDNSSVAMILGDHEAAGDDAGAGETEDGDDSDDSDDSDGSDGIDFFDNVDEAEWCLEDEHEDYTQLGVAAFNDDADIFTVDVKKAEVEIAYKLLTFLNPSNQLPASVLGTVVIDKPNYDASQEAELVRIENTLITYSQRQQASAQITILLSTMLKLHDSENGFAVRTEGLTAKRSRRNIVGDYNSTATRRWSKIKRAMRLNKFVARDIISGNPKLIDEIVRNPDQYLFQKFENFKTNAKKGKVLKAATQKKKVAKTRGGGAS
ncbi:hypothetical protein LTR95_003364 [Oleoguttula sp. CCFEE 5521]